MNGVEVLTLAAVLVAVGAQIGVIVNARRKRRLLRALWHKRALELRKQAAGQLAGEMAHGRSVYIAKTGVVPRTLAIGRWDARELAHAMAASMLPPATAREAFHLARDGIVAWGAEVKVDTRIGRMPRALWWHP